MEKEELDYAAAFNDGFKAGLEAAAKCCLEGWENGRGDPDNPPVEAWLCHDEIRALSPSPSATVHPQPNALPRPGE